MTDALVPQTLLYAPVLYEGREYFTSQYFHQQYRAHSSAGEKYRQHKNFLKAIRLIPLYNEYMTLGHIVEVVWDSVKSGATPEWSQWKRLFQSTGYQPLTLLDATAQVELSHHLDDEASKQIAHAANTQMVSHGDLLVQMAEAYRQQERRLLAIEAGQQAQRQQLIEDQAAIIAAQREALEAKNQATLALASQQWLTLRQYRHLKALQRECPDSVLKDYGVWLTGHCLEKGIPVEDRGVADRHWGKEHAYHVGVIEETLGGWLKRHNGQTTLNIVPKKGGA